MIRKSLPRIWIAGWVAVFRKDHAQTNMPPILAGDAACRQRKSPMTHRSITGPVETQDKPQSEQLRAGGVGEAVTCNRGRATAADLGCVHRQAFDFFGNAVPHKPSRGRQSALQ